MPVPKRPRLYAAAAIVGILIAGGIAWVIDLGGPGNTLTSAQAK